MNKVLEVEIEKLAVGGAGIARHQGQVIFVPASAPGDLLRVQITQQKKNFAEAEIVEVLKPGEGRIPPPCPVAGECGGCSWQHLSSQTQIEQKRLILSETLQKFLPELSLPELKITKSPKEFRYRNRIQPKIQEQEFGFFARKSHKLVKIEDCLICEEALASSFKRVEKEAVESKAEGRIEIFLDQNQVAHWRKAEEAIDGFGFSQVNRFQNEDLIQFVIESMPTAISPNSRIYDFYAGAGNFTFPLAQKFSQNKITAVEWNSKSVQRAAEHIKANPKLRQQVRYYSSSVDDFLRREAPSSQDLVLLDPPRSGCSDWVIRSLAATQPDVLIYIACHPVSLARDMAIFLAESKINYSCQSMALFEMFPQTDHFESIMVLKKQV